MKQNTRITNKNDQVKQLISGEGNAQVRLGDAQSGSGHCRVVLPPERREEAEERLGWEGLIPPALRGFSPGQGETSLEVTESPRTRICLFPSDPLALLLNRLF